MAAYAIGAALKPDGRRATYNRAMLKAVDWNGSVVRLLDQTKLPREVAYVDVANAQEMRQAMNQGIVRGRARAAALGFGAYLDVREHLDDAAPQFVQRLQHACEFLASSPPPQECLRQASQRIQQVARELAGEHVSASPACQLARDIADAILNECLAMMDQCNQDDTSDPSASG